MPAGIGVFGAEGRAEGVDIGKRRGKQLALQLSAHGQAGLGAEEVLVPGDAPVNLRRVVRVEGRHPEHLAGTLTVVGGNDRRMDVEETALLEEGVHRVGDTAAHAEHGPECVGPGAQVGNRTEELETVAFLLQRKSIVGLAVDKDILRLDLPVLAFARRRYHGAPDRDTIAGAKLFRNIESG